MIDGFLSGAKKMLKPAILVTLANIIFTFMLSTMESGNILTFISEKIAGEGDFNWLSVTGASMIGSFFFNSFYYLANVLNQIFSLHYTSESYMVLSFIIQGIHGIAMMILPTSLILVAGLSMLNITFKEWVKYIWKFLAQMLVIVLVLIIILALFL